MTTTEPVGTQPDLDDLIERDQQAIACPYPIFAQLRDESPVHWSETLGAWVCTRYDDILAVEPDEARRYRAPAAAAVGAPEFGLEILNAAGAQ